MYDFPALKRAPLIAPPRPPINESIIPIFHFPLFRSSPLIRTTSPRFAVVGCVLCFNFCLSRNDLRYSFVHLDQTTSLHLLIWTLYSDPSRYQQASRFHRLTTVVPLTIAQMTRPLYPLGFLYQLCFLLN